MPRQSKRRLAALDPSEVLEAAGGGQAPPVLLVTGGDLFSREAVLADLREALVAEGFEAFNAAALSGDEVSGERLADHAEMLPMGGGFRFIQVRRADRIREREIEAIARYASAPAATTCLVLVFDEAKGAVLTALRKVAPALDFPAPRDYQVARWLEAQARRMELSLDPDAARALADLVGEDFIAAMSELQKAALNATQAPGGKRGAAPRITRSIVEELASRGRDANPFHLADAVLGGEPARAVRILRDLHEAGVSGYVVLGMLVSQLRRFLKMRADLDAGKPARAVVQSASPTLPPPIVARLTRQLESFTEARLRQAFRVARRADRAIKSHGSGAELAHLESLVWRIAAS